MRAINAIGGGLLTGSTGGGAPSAGDFILRTYIGDQSADQPIATGQDLATNGGFVLGRGTNLILNTYVIDTVRGNDKILEAHTSSAEFTDDVPLMVKSFDGNGFTAAANSELNGDAVYAVNVWQRSTGFADVLTYTGNSSAGRTVSHSLGAVPAMMWVKTFLDRNWAVYHRDVAAPANGKFLSLDNNLAATTNSQWWNNTTPTSSVFTLGDIAEVNGNGENYVAYLFAEKAGQSKFGSYSGGGTVSTGLTDISVLMIKRTDAAGDWHWVYTNTLGGRDYFLINKRDAARSAGSKVTISGGDFTPFTGGGLDTGNFIYAAWR